MPTDFSHVLPQIGRHPVAGPIDTFVRPVDARDEKLAQLTRALAQFSPAVAAIGAQMQEGQNERDLQAGTEAGQVAYEDYRKQGLSVGDAVRKGVIPRGKSPFFMKGLAAQLGENVARAYAGAAADHLASIPGITLAGDDAVNNALSNFRGDWIKQNVGVLDDPAMSTGFKHQLLKQEDSLRADYARQHESALLDASQEASQQEFFWMQRDALKAGDYDPAKVGAALQERLDDHRNLGYSPALDNRSVVSSTLALALAPENVRNFDKIVSSLDGIRTGSGRLVDQFTSAELIRRARATANDMVVKLDAQARTKETEKRKDDESGVWHDLSVAAIDAKQRGVPLDVTPFQIRMNAVDATKVDQIAAFAQHVLEPLKTHDDPDTESHLADLGVTGGLTLGRLRADHDVGRITTDTFQSLYQRYLKPTAEQKTANAKTASALKDSYFTKAQTRVAKMAANVANPMNLTTKKAVADIAHDDMVRTLNAEYREYLESEQGQKATPLDRQDYIDRLEQRHMREMKPDQQQQSPTAAPAGPRKSHF